MTPAARNTEAELTARFGGIRFGRYNRRVISGTNIWSQHAFGNALDLFPPTSYGTPGIGGVIPPAYKAWLDNVYGWVDDNWAQLGLRAALWQVPDHYNHIHIDFWSHGIGTPALTQSGVADFVVKKGGAVWTGPQTSAPAAGSFTNFDDTSLQPVPDPGDDMTPEAETFFQKMYDDLVSLAAKPTSLGNVLEDYRERAALTGTDPANPATVAAATVKLPAAAQIAGQVTLLP